MTPPSTGLPSASRDVSGIETSLEYDSLGRLAWEKPAAGHGAWVEYQYTRGTSATAPAKVRIRRRTNGSETGTVLAQEEFQFDGFGRVAMERRQLPGLDWVARDTTYDSMGQVSTVSEWYDESAAGTPALTQYLGYDAFGRPGTLRPPDGSSHDVTMSYTGDRVVQRTVKIATSETSETSVTKTERYDRQGRLYQVVEPSAADGTDVTTSYSYDVGNRLSQVSTTSGTVTQVRTFTYDKRGFLTSETHPEKTGAVTYQGYDALGNAGRKIDGPSDLTFVYDAAERLTEIRDTGGAKLPWKSFTYATANGTNDWNKGKLLTATRYNRYDVLTEPTPGPDEIFSNGFECGDLSGWNGTELSCNPGTLVEYDIDVVETYTYGGNGGRVSQRDTAVTLAGSGGETFTQGFSYTDLGDVASLSYPRCDFTRCTGDGDAGSARTVSFTYTRGLLTAIPGYTGTIEYHPNGLVYRTYHTGAARQVQSPDANGMARPSEIFAKLDTTTVWTTGSYAYDGAGNVKSMGDSSFVYDKVSRLSSAKVSLGQQGTGSLVERGYTYDAFGNLTEISGSGGRTIPTNSGTNRLSGSVSYDNAGNLLSWNGNLYEYDPLHMMKRLTTPGGGDWLYVYTADDERVWMYDLVGTTSRYTLRGLSGKVLREYTVAGDYWTRERDYVYSNGHLFATETPQGLRHFYTDHLGTPRLVTDASGNQVAYHVYYPFGEEATSPVQDKERMKFTGHERDLADLSGAGDDLDYMRARFCSPLTGRFFSTDPLDSGRPRAPQSWNRYAYTLDNPINLVDPTGLYETTCASGDQVCQANVDAFETARQANLKRGGDIAATALAYGERGEANGITVQFAVTKAGSAANVEADIVYNDAGTFSFVATVTIDPSLQGTRLEAAVGHEGQHLVDAQAFAATFTNRGWNLSKNLTIQQLETRAYKISHLILFKSNTSQYYDGTGGRLVRLGRGVPEGDLDQAIEDILNGPLYFNELQKRQFAYYTIQP